MLSRIGSAKAVGGLSARLVSVIAKRNYSIAAPAPIVYTKKFQEMLELAKEQVDSVTIEEVDALVAQGAITLDIRDPDEHEVDHLKNGLHLSRGKLEMLVEKLIPDLDTKILCYCNANHRGALSAASLKSMGYLNANFIAGGLRGYRAQAAKGNNMLL